jgi:hypothetical protein
MPPSTGTVPSPSSISACAITPNEDSIKLKINIILRMCFMMDMLFDYGLILVPDKFQYLGNSPFIDKF